MTYIFLQKLINMEKVASLGPNYVTDIRDQASFIDRFVSLWNFPQQGMKSSDQNVFQNSFYLLHKWGP